MKLYGYFRSSASFRIRIALNAKATEYEDVFISLPAGEQNGSFKQINPQGLLPVLEDNGLVLTQSLAIIDYLENKFPYPPLFPAARNDRAIAMSMALAIGCDIHPLNNLRILNYLKNNMGHDQSAVNEWYRHWIYEGFSALEVLVEKYGSAEFCFGSSLSVADIFLAPQMWNARRFNADLSAFPRLVAIDHALMLRPSFAKAAPENQRDAV